MTATPDPKRLLGQLNREHFENTAPAAKPPHEWLIGDDALRPAREPDVGEVLESRFVVTGVLGQGAMGRVLAARELETDREVALKLIISKGNGAQLQERLRREAELTARVRHPGVLGIHGVGEHRGVPFLVYEKLDGARPLAEALPTLAREQRLDLLELIADAVAAAHSVGVVHRDLKPENVLLDGAGRPFVVDFGLALDIDKAGDRLTQSGALLGSPIYMSPEQITGRRHQIGPTTDVWALGVMLYELLTDARPFEADSFPVLAARICSSRPPMPSGNGGGRGWDSVVRRALAQDPLDRFPNAGAFAEALRRARSASGTWPGRWLAAAAVGLCVAVLVALNSTGPETVDPVEPVRPVVTPPPPLPAERQTDPGPTEAEATERAPRSWERTFLDFGGLRFRDDTLLVVAAGSELRQVDVQTGETVSRLRVWAKQVRLTAGGLIREGDAFLLPSANWKSVNEALPVPADVAQFSPSGRWLAWSRGPFLRVAAPDALKTPRLDAVHPERISDIVLSESFVAVMGRNLIAWWNLETGVKRTLASRPHALALDSSLGSLFMGNKDGLLLQIRLSDGEELQRYTRKTPSARAHFVGHAAHTSKIAALRVVNEGRHIVSAAFSRTHYCNAAIWSRDGEELWRSEDVLGGYDYVDVSPDFRRLALGSRASNKVRILSLKKILAR